MLKRPFGRISAERCRDVNRPGETHVSVRNHSGGLLSCMPWTDLPFGISGGDFRHGGEALESDCGSFLLLFLPLSVRCYSSPGVVSGTSSLFRLCL